jgi:hypothetical protein
VTQALESRARVASALGCREPRHAPRDVFVADFSQRLAQIDPDAVEALGLDIGGVEQPRLGLPRGVHEGAAEAPIRPPRDFAPAVPTLREDANALVDRAAVIGICGSSRTAMALRLLRAATEGDDRAAAIVDDLVDLLAPAARNISSLLDPESILIGGGRDRLQHYLPDRDALGGGYRSAVRRRVRGSQV